MRSKEACDAIEIERWRELPKRRKRLICRISFRQLAAGLLVAFSQAELMRALIWGWGRVGAKDEKKCGWVFRILSFKWTRTWNRKRGLWRFLNTSVSVLASLRRWGGRVGAEGDRLSWTPESETKSGLSWPTLNSNIASLKVEFCNNFRFIILKDLARLLLHPVWRLELSINLLLIFSKVWKFAYWPEAACKKVA